MIKEVKALRDCLRQSDCRRVTNYPMCELVFCVVTLIGSVATLPVWAPCSGKQSFSPSGINFAIYTVKWKPNFSRRANECQAWPE